ncbi:MAG: methyltransferase [Mollicutes bacterium]|nr:methyltransferase [Mollicutes bacterium]
MKKYDYIITNSPIRVSKKILYQILFGAKEYLVDNGELWLVVNKNQGAKSIIKNLEKEYNVNIVCKSKVFFIICARNN